jgi:hypothetical protein
MENKEFCFRVNLSKLDSPSGRLKFEKQVKKIKNRINEKFGYEDSDSYYMIGAGFKDAEQKKIKFKICYK